MVFCSVLSERTVGAISPSLRWPQLSATGDEFGSLCPFYPPAFLPMEWEGVVSWQKVPFPDLPQSREQRTPHLVLWAASPGQAFCGKRGHGTGRFGFFFVLPACICVRCPLGCSHCQLEGLCRTSVGDAAGHAHVELTRN